MAKFVSNINVTDRYRNFIAAGTPFLKEVLVKHTFNKLQMQGHIEEYVVGKPMLVRSGPKGKMLASIPGTTPDAAIHPPHLSAEQKAENSRQANVDKKQSALSNAEKKAAKEAEKAAKAEAALKEEQEAKAALEAAEAEDAEETAKAAEAEASEEESTVERIWVCNPETIKDVKFEILLSEYRTQCDKFNIEPEKFDDKELLIAKLSSEYVPK